MTDYLFDPSVQVTEHVHRKRIKVAEKTLHWHIGGEKTQPVPALQRAVNEYRLKAPLVFSKKGEKEYLYIGTDNQETLCTVVSEEKECPYGVNNPYRVGVVYTGELRYYIRSIDESK